VVKERVRKKEREGKWEGRGKGKGGESVPLALISQFDHCVFFFAHLHWQWH